MDSDSISKLFGLTVTEWNTLKDYMIACEASDTLRLMKEISALRSKVGFYESRIKESMQYLDMMKDKHL